MSDKWAFDQELERVRKEHGCFYQLFEKRGKKLPAVPEDDEKIFDSLSVASSPSVQKLGGGKYEEMNLKLREQRGTRGQKHCTSRREGGTCSTTNMQTDILYQLGCTVGRVCPSA